MLNRGQRRRLFSFILDFEIIAFYTIAILLLNKLFNII
ncbi:hypothetical protein ES708_15125 [subsurface metagenome]